jgi:hypothetical protein
MDGEGEGDSIRGDGDIMIGTLRGGDCDREGIAMRTETLIFCGPEGDTVSLTFGVELTLIFDGIFRSGSGETNIGGGGLMN